MDLLHKQMACLRLGSGQEGGSKGFMKMLCVTKMEELKELCK